MHHPVISSVLVGGAAALAIACAIGLAIVTNALERLHFPATVTSFSAGLIVLGVWIDDPNWQARLKATLIAVILFLMNSILSHSTARAIRIFENGQFDPRENEPVLEITHENPTDASGQEQK